LPANASGCGSHREPITRSFGARGFRSAQAQLQETLRGALAGSHDGVAMLLLVAMNYALQTRMSRQG
jgi:hypothetical protein